jgi:serine/threonine protein kinase
VDAGWRPTEEQAVALTLQLLSVLQYLESLRPPVVHRDIKPANILVDRADNNRVSLVDFGAVAAANPAATMGSTIIGTYGCDGVNGEPLATHTHLHTLTLSPSLSHAHTLSLLSLSLFLSHSHTRTLSLSLSLTLSLPLSLTHTFNNQPASAISCMGEG